MKNDYKTMSLQELVEKAQMQDHMAFSQLYERYAPSIYYYGLKLAHNEADAKDIVQDTFIQAQQSIQSLKEPKLFKVWLNRIAFSRATRLFSRNRTISFDPDDSVLVDHAVESRRDMIPQDQMHFQSDKELLDYFIAKLPLEQQAVLILMYYEDFSLQEIALIMDIPIGTVKSRIHMAKGKLSQMIQAYERKNDTKVTFRAEGLIPMLVAYYAQDSKEMAILPLANERMHFHLSDHAKKRIAILTTTLAASAILIYCMGARTEPMPSDRDENTIQQSSLELHPLPLVIYQGQMYDRADDAYYALLAFAHCEVEMKTKSETDFAGILPLYEKLKDYGGIYYEKLQEDHWITSFEFYAYKNRQ